MSHNNTSYTSPLLPFRLSLPLPLLPALAFHCSEVVYLKLLLQQRPLAAMWGHCVKYEWQNKAIRREYVCMHAYVRTYICTRCRRQGSLVLLLTPYAL